jgi:transcriptional regulator GlxA family with amidase domain
LFNITKPDFDNPDMSIDQKPFTILNKASHFIMTNLSQDLSVNDVASSVFTSERNLRHLFRKHMNTTVVDYINSKKMEHASYLLTLQLQVQEVSEAVGIASPAQFSRLFKRYQGTSPKKFQQNHEPIYT